MNNKPLSKVIAMILSAILVVSVMPPATVSAEESAPPPGESVAGEPPIATPSSATTVTTAEKAPTAAGLGQDGIIQCETMLPYKVSVDGVVFDSSEVENAMEAAYDAVSDYGTIKLESNIVFDQSHGLNMRVQKNFTLDLNGYTIGRDFDLRGPLSTSMGIVTISGRIPQGGQMPLSITVKNGLIHAINCPSSVEGVTAGLMFFSGNYTLSNLFIGSDEIRQELGEGIGVADLPTIAISLQAANLRIISGEYCAQQAAVYHDDDSSTTTIAAGTFFRYYGPDQPTGLVLFDSIASNGYRNPTILYEETSHCFSFNSGEPLFEGVSHTVLSAYNSSLVVEADESSAKPFKIGTQLFSTIQEALDYARSRNITPNIECRRDTWPIMDQTAPRLDSVLNAVLDLNGGTLSVQMTTDNPAFQLTNSTLTVRNGTIVQRNINSGREMFELLASSKLVLENVTLDTTSPVLIKGGSGTGMIADFRSGFFKAKTHIVDFSGSQGSVSVTSGSFAVEPGSRCFPAVTAANTVMQTEAVVPRAWQDAPVINVLRDAMFYHVESDAYYNSLNAAVIGIADAENPTLRLLKDCELTDMQALRTGLTIDLNGFTISRDFSEVSSDSPTKNLFEVSRVEVTPLRLLNGEINLNYTHENDESGITAFRFGQPDIHMELENITINQASADGSLSSGRRASNLPVFGMTNDSSIRLADTNINALWNVFMMPDSAWVEVVSCDIKMRNRNYGGGGTGIFRPQDDPYDHRNEERREVDPTSVVKEDYDNSYVVEHYGRDENTGEELIWRVGENIETALYFGDFAAAARQAAYVDDEIYLNRDITRQTGSTVLDPKTGYDVQLYLNLNGMTLATLDGTAPAILVKSGNIVLKNGEVAAADELSGGLAVDLQPDAGAEAGVRIESGEYRGGTHALDMSGDKDVMIIGEAMFYCYDNTGFIDSVFKDDVSKLLDPSHLGLPPEKLYKMTLNTITDHQYESGILNFLIGDKEYIHLMDAWADVPAGGTITLARNMETNTPLVLPAQKTLTFDLDGKSITLLPEAGDIDLDYALAIGNSNETTVPAGTVVTVTNGTVNSLRSGSKGSDSFAIYVINADVVFDGITVDKAQAGIGVTRGGEGGGGLTRARVRNCDITGDKAALFSGRDGKIIVESGEFYISDESLADEKVRYWVFSSDHYDGSTNYVVLNNTIELDETSYSIPSNITTASEHISVRKIDNVAKLYDEGDNLVGTYNSLDGAIEAAREGYRVQLQVSLRRFDPVIIDKEITLDLGWYTLSSAGSFTGKHLIETSRNLKITSGSAEFTSIHPREESSLVWLTEGNISLTLAGAHLRAFGGYGVKSNSVQGRQHTVNMDGSSIRGNVQDGGGFSAVGDGINCVKTVPDQQILDEQTDEYHLIFMGTGDIQIRRANGQLDGTAYTGFQQAVDAAEDGDTIIFNVRKDFGGTVTIDNKDITVDGNGLTLTADTGWSGGWSEYEPIGQTFAVHITGGASVTFEDTRIDAGNPFVGTNENPEDHRGALFGVGVTGNSSLRFIRGEIRGMRAALYVEPDSNAVLDPLMTLTYNWDRHGPDFAWSDGTGVVIWTEEKASAENPDVPENIRINGRLMVVWGYDRPEIPWYSRNTVELRPFEVIDRIEFETPGTHTLNGRDGTLALIYKLYNKDNEEISGDANTVGADGLLSWDISANNPGVSFDPNTETFSFSGITRETLVTLTAYNRLQPDGIGTLNLTVIPSANGVAPSISDQPDDAAVTAGENAAFSVTAVSDSVLSYRWAVSADGGATWVNITNTSKYSGATTDTLTLTGAAPTDSGNQYRCRVTNSYGDATSGAAMLTVNAAPTYAVTVNSGVGGGNFPAGVMVSITADAAPTGKQFREWAVQRGGVTLANPQAQSTTFTMPAGAVEVTATYETLPENTYSVTVQNDGNGTANADVSAAREGATITLTAVANDGYKFNEWQVVSGTIALSGAAANPATFTMPGESVTVKAIFEPIRYTVTFNANGGSVSPASAQTGEGGKLSSLPTPTRNDHSFNGWYTATSGGAKITVNTVFGANATVYAQWTYIGAGPVPTPTPTSDPTPTPGGTQTPTPGGTQTPTPGGTQTSAPGGTQTPAPGGTQTPTPNATPETPANSALLTVWFVDWDSTLLKLEEVRRGGDATAPADPAREGYIFNGWDVPFTNVQDNLTVTAQYVVDSAINGGIIINGVESNIITSDNPPPEEVRRALIEEQGIPAITIGDQEIPLSAGPFSNLVWALANLILAVIGVILAIVTAIRVMKRKKEEERDGAHEKHLRGWLIATVIMGAAGVALFLLTKDMSRLMVLTDNLTIASAVILIAEIVGVRFTFKRAK